MIEAAVDVKGVWKTVTTVLDTEAGSKLIKKSCLPQAWA